MPIRIPLLSLWHCSLRPCSSGMSLCLWGQSLPHDCQLRHIPCSMNPLSLRCTQKLVRPLHTMRHSARGIPTPPHARSTPLLSHIKLMQQMCNNGEIFDAEMLSTCVHRSTMICWRWFYHLKKKTKARRCVEKCSPNRC